MRGPQEVHADARRPGGHRRWCHEGLDHEVWQPPEAPRDQGPCGQGMAGGLQGGERRGDQERGAATARALRKVCILPQERRAQLHVGGRPAS